MAALGIFEWLLMVLPLVGVLLAFLLNRLDEMNGYPERMRQIREVD